MDLLGVRALPFLARRNYYYEFKHLVLWSVCAALVEGQFASVIVSKTFNGSERLIAVAAATPIGAQIFSLLWGMLCIGRPKVALAGLFAAGITLCVGMTAAIPASPTGAVWFVAQMAAAQVLLAGLNTVRSAFWKSNYPTRVRGMVAARLHGVRFVMSVVTVLAASAACDRDPSSYRFIFPCAALAGVCGAALLGRLHIRGERRQLATKSGALTVGEEQARIVEPFDLSVLLSPGHVLGQMIQVLRDDRRFARYCTAQLFSGLANLMTVSVIVAVITRDLSAGETQGFWISTALIIALPRVVMLGSLRRWGALFDRLAVVRFRVVNVTCWTATLALGLAATLVTVSSPNPSPGRFLAGVGLFVLRALVYGLAVGGGQLAWSIGHLYFAAPERAEIYMGIHVSLTGLRGLIAPLVGMWLWKEIGFGVWLIAIGLSLLSLFLYAWLARVERREGVAGW